MGALGALRGHELMPAGGLVDAQHERPLPLADSTGRCNTLIAAYAAGVLQMKRRPRLYYSDSQKALMWERWKQGWTLHEIGKLFDRPHTSVQQILAQTGGFQPPERARSSTALTLAEREEISRAMVAGDSIRATAARLGRAPSTISREVKRNGGRRDYRASKADGAAWDRALRPKRRKLWLNCGLARIVAEKLRALWSPEQIAGWLKQAYPHDESLHVSHETIYRSLFVQARGALKKELLEHLRRTRGMRRSRHHTQKTASHGKIIDAIPISERPACVEDRAVPGHWEGDLVFGGRNSQIATLVERQTRYVMLVKVDHKDTETVIDAGRIASRDIGVDGRLIRASSSVEARLTLGILHVDLRPRLRHEHGRGVAVLRRRFQVMRLQRDIRQLEPGQAFRNASVEEHGPLQQLRGLVVVDVPLQDLFQERLAIRPGKHTAAARSLLAEDGQSRLRKDGVSELIQRGQQRGFPGARGTGDDVAVRGDASGHRHAGHPAQCAELFENTLMTTTPRRISAIPTIAATSRRWLNRISPSTEMSTMPTPDQMA